MHSKRIIGSAMALVLAASMFGTNIGYKPDTVSVSATQLSTAYTGEEILQYAKDTYDTWGYEDVDTCTGLVSHVFYEDLKVPNALDIIGPRVFVGYGSEPYNGYLTRYNPDSMLENARKMVSEGKAICVYEGSTRGVYNSKIPIRDGDLVFTTREEMGAAYGHVAIMENKLDEDGTIGWWGAHGPASTKDQEVAYHPFARDDDDKTTSNKTYFPGYFTGTVHIYRVVDYASPVILEDVTASKDVAYGLCVTKLDAVSGSPVEGAKVVFTKGKDSVEEDTNTDGVAQYTEIKTIDVDGSDFRYVTNYAKLSPEDKEEIDENGLYHSYEEAQEACDKALLDKAVIEEPDYESIVVTDTNTGIEYKASDGGVENFSITVNDIHVTKKNIKIIGSAAGAQCEIVDEAGNVVDEFITSEISGGTVGYIAKGLTMDTRYTINELVEPSGYIKSKPVTFTVGDEDVIYLCEEPVLGILNAKVMGEVFKQFENNNAIYEVEELSDVPLTLYAKEDIKIGTKIVYSRGQVVGTTTDNQFSNLPVGHYYIEVGASTSGYVTNGKKYPVTINCCDNIADPVYEQEITLDKQTYTISVSNYIESGKLSRDDTVAILQNNKVIYTSGIDADGIIELSKSVLLPSGEYTIKCEDKKLDSKFNIDVKDSSVSKYVVYLGKSDNQVGTITINIRDEDGASISGAEVSLARDYYFTQSVDTGRSGKDGVITFDNLEMGTYYLRQNNSSNLYSVSGDLSQIELSTKLPSLEIDVVNKVKDVIIDSTDLGGVLSVPGITLELRDSSGNVVDEWVTDKLSHISTGLVEGETYTVVAVDTASGYGKPADIEFTMTDGLAITVKSRATSDGFGGLIDASIGTNYYLLAIMTFIFLGLMYISSPWEYWLAKFKRER